MGVCSCVCDHVWVALVVGLVAIMDMEFMVVVITGMGGGVTGMGNQWTMVVMKKEG